MDAIAYCLIAIAIDLVVFVSIYSMASYFCARLAWQRGGTAALFLLILLSQLFWIPLAILTATPTEFDGVASYSAWFANWLVTGFALVLLRRKTQDIPRALEDTARLDGLGALGTWRHAVLPFVKRELVLLAILLLMALLMAGWRFLFGGPDAVGPSRVVVHLVLTPTQYVALAMGASLLGAFPLVGLFFLAKRPN
jgi:ABC-type glycerol-3-phosphate transport system permease component